LLQPSPPRWRTSCVVPTPTQAGERLLRTVGPLLDEIEAELVAAHAAGLTDVVIPERNRGDLDEIPQEVRDAVRFHPVMTVAEVLELALEPARNVALS